MHPDAIQSLVPARVQEILLVSSDYDAFVLEEDGALTDRLFTEYGELLLSGVPRITHVTTGAQAMAVLTQRRFDLVMTVVRVEDVEVTTLSQQIKQLYSALPVVLLTFDESDLDAFPGQLPETIDRAFLWTGDAKALLAVIKLIEDELNVEHDAALGVRVILVVEDRLRAYTGFLSLLYPELLSQARSMVADGLNDAERVSRMRTRPKILLATSFDEGMALFRRYRDQLMALISDIRVPQGGVLASGAGIELAARVRGEMPRLPILLQSTEPYEDKAKLLGAWFLDKASPDYRTGLRIFLEVGLGFGDFVFRLSDRTEVGRARDIFELREALEHVDADSVVMHAERNDFSTWLNARSRFALADAIRERTRDEFAEGEAIRRYLLDELGQTQRREQEGVITDFTSQHTGPRGRFVRLGTGSLGGKGRSVAFLAAQIVRHRLLHEHEGLEIRIPKTLVLGTDLFDAFMSQYDLGELMAMDDDAAILQRILDGALPDEAVHNLPASFSQLRGPLAVRSSSLVEDSRFQPFAGVYATYMLPNNHPDPQVRLAELRAAIKAVYASAFSRGARTYAAGTPHLLQSQKMAVLIQQVVGQRHGDRFYPHASGVAQSYNYYPISSQLAEEGVAAIALGMGETVVSGGKALRFSPGAPGVQPQFSSARSMLRWSQTEFYAVDLSRTRLDLHAGPEGSLVLCDLSDAEADGTLAPVGSVYCAQDDVIRDNLKLAGPRVVSFRSLLEWGAIPLAPALLRVLRLLRESMGGEVELEFALDLADWGKRVPRGREPRTPRLYLLQARPMGMIEMTALDVDLERIEEAEVLCRTERALGHGVIEGIRDVVYIRRDDPPATLTREIAREVGRLDRALGPERPYLLIGPGRWGTSDPGLGIPVDYTDIAGARVIVETPMGHRQVDHSQGAHFFQNVTSRRIGYLTVFPRFAGVLDREWLDAQREGEPGEHVRHVRLSQPLTVLLDGRAGTAVIVKRAPKAWHEDEDEDGL